jgi:hypothetical protein
LRFLPDLAPATRLLVAIPLVPHHPFRSGHTTPFKLPLRGPGARAGARDAGGRRGTPPVEILTCGRIAVTVVDRGLSPACRPRRPVASSGSSDRLSSRARTSPLYSPVRREPGTPLAESAFAPADAELRRTGRTASRFCRRSDWPSPGSPERSRRTLAWAALLLRYAGVCLPPQSATTTGNGGRDRSGALAGGRAPSTLSAILPIRTHSVRQIRFEVLQS